MRILLLCTAFNGLSQRAWIELRALGHDVTVHAASDTTPIETAARAADPDLIICPYLKDRVPAGVWQRYRTIIVHPGPMGDRGPSSLDWAIAEGAADWGVTALQAVEEMDAGPIWASRTFLVPHDAPRKSSLYNGPVADAAIDVILEVVAKAADRSFSPSPLDYTRPDVTGRLRPLMTQADRAFSWEEPTSHILRKIRAADGSPGVRTVLGGRDLSVFDAHPGPGERNRPGTIIGAQSGAVLVATGDGSIWIGHARHRQDGQPSLKLPAGLVLSDQLRGLQPVLADPWTKRSDRYEEISYRRHGDVGVLGFDFYNGAMSTAQCRRLTSAMHRAIDESTRVLVLRGGEVFSNGIHLNVIEAAASPAAESWANINAIDDLCCAIIRCTKQLVVASVGANAGAGGVMLALGADRVYLREAAVLNPHYATMGLYGSEYWTYVLPRRVGADRAAAVTTGCVPVGAAQAARINLVDEVLPGTRGEFERAVLDRAAALAASSELDGWLQAKRARLEGDEQRKPLEAYRTEELGEMSRDIFDNRSGYDEARRAFVFKRLPELTPPHLAAA